MDCGLGFYCVPCPVPTSLVLLVKEFFFLWRIYSKWFGWDRRCPIFTDVQETLSWSIRILCALGQTNWIKGGHVTQSQVIRSFNRAFLPKVLGKKLYCFQVANLVGCEPLVIDSLMLTIRRAPGIDRALMISWKSLSNQTYPLDFSVTWVKIFLFLIFTW